jgi:hypothetical protein
MSKRKSHLGAAKVHGRRAVAELRHMTADSALYWVLSHKDRVAKFRRAVRGTRAAKPLDQLLTLVREEASTLTRAAPRKRKAVRARRRRPVSRFVPPPFLIG